jgi:hypothetical protein
MQRKIIIIVVVGMDNSAKSLFRSFLERDHALYQFFSA